MKKVGMYRKEADKGFTIVELLVVVVVIAILAAVTIVAYQGISTRARISSFQATLSQIRTSAETSYVESSKWPFEDDVRAALATNLPSSATTAQNVIIQWFGGKLAAAQQPVQVTTSCLNTGINKTDVNSTCPIIDASGRLTWVVVMQPVNDTGDSYDSTRTIIGSGSPTISSQPNSSNLGQYR